MMTIKEKSRAPQTRRLATELMLDRLNQMPIKSNVECKSFDGLVKFRCTHSSHVNDDDDDPNRNCLCIRTLSIDCIYSPRRIYYYYMLIGSDSMSFLSFLRPYQMEFLLFMNKISIEISNCNGPSVSLLVLC